jgi:hypothetical protein
VSFSTVDLSAPTSQWTGMGTDRPVAILARTKQAVAVRFAIGIVAAAGALVLPWVGLTLTPSLRAWNLTFSLGAVPLLHHLSYGSVVAFLTACAVVSFVRAGGRTTLVTHAVGWAYLALSLTFVFTTRLVGIGTMFKLEGDVNQTAIINSQFLTNSSTPAPTQFLGISFDGKTLVLLYGLRLGWYLLLVAGMFLAGRFGRPSGRAQWVAYSLSGLAVLVVAAGLVLGSMAQSDMDNGIQAVATGHPAAGQDLISSALRLNPETAYDPGLEQALGQAEADQGRTNGLTEFAQAVRPVGKDLTLLEQARLFGQAISALPVGSPASLVVQTQVVSFLSNATISVKNPNVLALAHGELGAPAVSFSVGRYDYEAGASSLAISLLQRAYAETDNSEVKSLALTYIALAWQRLGNESAFRTNIVAAVKADSLNENVFAREISAGLYVPGTP